MSRFLFLLPLVFALAVSCEGDKNAAGKGGNVNEPEPPIIGNVSPSPSWAPPQSAATLSPSKRILRYCSAYSLSLRKFK